ncbi:MAG: DUF4278 domain-containing protein [Elainella sp.]
MQLSYRGVRYSQLKESMDGSPSPIEMVDSGIEGHYRGHTYHFTYPRHLSPAAALQPVRRLCYRGAAYGTTAAGIRSYTPAAPLRPVSRPMQPVTELSSARASRAEASVGLTTRAVNLAAKEYNNIHQRYIQERLQHRIDVARAQGNQHLLQMLEREMQQVG